MAGQEGDLYWNDTTITGLDFNDEGNEDLKSYESSVRSATRLSQQVRDSIKLDSGESSQQFPISIKKVEKRKTFPLSQLISEHALNAILEAENYDYFIQPSSMKPEEEVRVLRRKVQAQWKEPDIDTTFKNLVVGLPYSFENFRSLSSKKKLLNSAIEFGDGDAILEVICFLSRTLRRNLFQKILIESPVGVRHYSTFLSTKMMLPELTDLLEILGKNEETAMKHFSLTCQNPKRNLKKIQSISVKYLLDSTDRIYVDNFVRLVEWQLKNSPEKVGSSLKETVFELCHRGKDSKLEQALALAREYKLDEKETQWTILTAKAADKDWEAVQSMFVTKNWLGVKKIKSDLPVPDVILLLHQNQAPQELLFIFFDMMDDLEWKIFHAKNLKLNRVVIDIFTSQKDRISLLSFLSDLGADSEDYVYGDKILRSGIKWKN